MKIAQVLKRTADTILENNGILRSFQHLGSKTLPYRMKSHEGSKTEGVLAIHGVWVGLRRIGVVNNNVDSVRTSYKKGMS